MACRYHDTNFKRKVKESRLGGSGRLSDFHAILLMARSMKHVLQFVFFSKDLTSY